MQREAVMTTTPCLVLYGNSVFLAGIKAEFERYRDVELISVEAACRDVTELIRARKPRAVLFDLTMAQPDFAIPLLCEQPALLLIGVDPSSNEMLVLSSHPARALTIHDLMQLVLENSQTQEKTSK